MLSRTQRRFETTKGTKNTKYFFPEHKVKMTLCDLYFFVLFVPFVVEFVFVPLTDLSRDRN